MLATERSIFYDPAGKRWPFFKRLLLLLVGITSVLGAVLCGTILLLPVSPVTAIYRDAIKSFIVKPDAKREAARLFLAARSRRRLLSGIAAEQFTTRTHASLTTAAPITVGFYVNWDPNSFNSLRAHIDALSYVMPEWLSLGSSGAQPFTSAFSDAARDPEVVTLASSHHVPIIPILNNENNDDFRWAPLQQLLTDHARQVALANKLRDYLLAQHFAGINIDFELPYNQLTDAEVARATPFFRRALPQFMALLKQTFAPTHLLVTQDLPAGDAGFDNAALGKVNDFVVLMLYDQHTPSDDPGPIAAQDWVEQSAGSAFVAIPASKVVLGMGNYAYDWPITIDAQGAMHRAGDGRELMLGAALHLAQEAGASIEMDDGDVNPYFTYEDTDNQDHIVYLLDAATAYNTIHALHGYAPRGAALWYLGSEDPTLWSFFDDDKLDKPVAPSALSSIDFKDTLDTDTNPTGDELMLITAVSAPGLRTMTRNADGLITAEHYLQYPSPYVLRQFGTANKAIALTFDDGPDPRWTPQILRVLEQHGVPGTFFVIGQQAAQYPGIVRQAWQDGDDLGNHTYTHPHIALVSPLRASLEVNATQRILESITGHMSLLFRPPFGESPDTGKLGPQDLAMMLQMQRDGFVIVGMNIDPKDYEAPTPQNPNTPRTIVWSVDAQLKAGNHIILLHDGGGDRSRTVAALPLIIHDLKARGYHFVTVSQLMGPGWHDKLFPVVPHQQEEIAGLDHVIFEIGFAFNLLLRCLFLSAIVLGVLRILLFGVLAIAHSRRKKGVLEAYTAPVTVAIPAYNEGKVVCRTVESVLVSDYPALHVIAVDDGSTDDTAAALQEQFGNDPRVTIVRKENGGKASALNTAFALATTEIVVCMDADTLFTPTTVRLLVQPFADPRVGAVAGNVKVGNRLNLLAIWQSLEYITSQNFDRRAFAQLDAVAVVPGAAGAWRTSAVTAAGGFASDTLAEDTDLTFKVRLLGYATRCQNTALAFTEAPDSVSTLAKQRFRWAFGILQALWKHRRSLFQPQYGAFSMLVMPSMWLFNIFLQALAPVVDLCVLLAILNGQLPAVLYYTAAFFALDLIASFVSFALDGENPRPILWLFGQRFFYREFLYYIILKALLAAMRGGSVGWGKLQRKATVLLPQ